LKNREELDKFIAEFNLKHPDGMISFPAKIIYYINEYPRLRYSDVQIITSADLNTIYFLNKNLQPEDLRDIFRAPEDIFIHQQDKGLVIKTENTRDIIEIYPIL
jgi:hypothetical protein